MADFTEVPSKWKNCQFDPQLPSTFACVFNENAWVKWVIVGVTSQSTSQ